MAEASAGLPGWPAHLEAALDGATDDSGRVAAAMVLALALGRAHQSAAAVGVLDRAASLLDSAEPGLAARLEAATVGVGIIDVATAPAMARRREALLERAAARSCGAARAARGRGVRVGDHQRPAAVAAELAERALAAGAGRAQRRDRPALVRARHVVLPDDGLAAVGRAL